jgi:hypothetical protein
MALKEVMAPHLGRTVKMGRKHTVTPGPRMKLKNYLRANLPAPPASCDYSPAALSALENIYMNDTLGDCVIAGGYHVVATETGNAGDMFTATNAQIIKDYSAIGGYVPGDPSTDQGCDEETALNYWEKNGFANGTKPLGWIAVDATNVQEIMTACYLFENLYFGMELPDKWVSPMPSGSGFTWDVAGAPDPQNGHCIIGVGYTASGVKVDTWGMFGTLTFAAIAKYCVATAGGQLYVLITPDQLSKGMTKAPNGVAWADLISDFDSMGGNVPVPAPAPAPSPSPAPSPTPVNPPAPSPVPSPSSTGPTLEQATTWAQSQIVTAPFIMTRSQAESYIAAGLKANWPASS